MVKFKYHISTTHGVTSLHHTYDYWNVRMIYMKSRTTKFTNLLLVLIICVVALSSCYDDWYFDSLDEYVEGISKPIYGGGAHSHKELDSAENFLPSKTFFEDFEYIYGEYYFYEEDPLRLRRNPEICFLYLQYESDIYVDAKEYMQENIKSANGEIYEYNGYCFYINANFKADSGGHNFPKYFTAACYNDTKHILMFIGFCEGYPSLDEKYLTPLSTLF